MSSIYYEFYKRLIKNKKNDYTERQLIEKIDNQKEKGRFSDLEYTKLIELINERFKEV